jgi:hypothetical protein
MYVAGIALTMYGHRPGQATWTNFEAVASPSSIRPLAWAHNPGQPRPVICARPIHEPAADTRHPSDLDRAFRGEMIMPAAAKCEAL